MSGGHRQEVLTLAGEVFAECRSDIRGLYSATGVVNEGVPPLAGTHVLLVVGFGEGSNGDPTHCRVEFREESQASLLVGRYELGPGGDFMRIRGRDAQSPGPDCHAMVSVVLQHTVFTPNQE